ncbi:FIST signal transduction protein [Ascidiimonas sp. W6]|uniref:FIST signal transduction protein n=1 Tax=Ascidiimonas meishanensis TaxID=3128903 RepID=UPI0030EED602
MYIEVTDPKLVANIISDKANDDAVLICIAEHTDINIEILIDELNARGTNFAGGFFPKVIHGKQVFDTGIVVSFFDSLVEDGIFMIKHMDSMNFTIPPKDLDKNASYCMLTFVDGLAPNISHYLSELYRQFGSKIFYFGGGAGSLSLKQRPSVFSKEGIFQNAAVCMLLKKQVSVGVKHGWQKIAGPVIATRTSRNVINQLNWEDALGIYKAALEDKSDIKVEKDNFFSVAKAYPFGILKDGAEYVVRDPISIDESGGLICVGEVPENTILDILWGEENTLILAAKEAAQSSADGIENPKQAFIIDCISRALFLEDNFFKELAEVEEVLLEAHEPSEINGALTLGEISSQGNGYLEFYNKTIVIGLFE